MAHWKCWQSEPLFRITTNIVRVNFDGQGGRRVSAGGIKTSPSLSRAHRAFQITPIAHLHSDNPLHSQIPIANIEITSNAFPMGPFPSRGRPSSARNDAFLCWVKSRIRVKIINTFFVFSRPATCKNLREVSVRIGQKKFVNCFAIDLANRQITRRKKRKNYEK